MIRRSFLLLQAPLVLGAAAPLRAAPPLTEPGPEGTPSGSGPSGRIVVTTAPGLTAASVTIEEK
ncbi:MAG TPA: hypothetical protein VE959_29185 [Bryobacteraceae bacterium]|nr:hypothetical protein [Bryobacteraceae bacterium]